MKQLEVLKKIKKIYPQKKNETLKPRLTCKKGHVEKSNPFQAFVPCCPSSSYFILMVNQPFPTGAVVRIPAV